MKKAVATLLVFILIVLSFSGCDENNSSSQNSSITWPKASGDSVFIGVQQGNNSQNETTSSENKKSSANKNTSSNSFANDDTDINSYEDYLNSLPNDIKYDSEPNDSYQDSEDENLFPPIIDTHQEEYRPSYLLGNCRTLKDNPMVVAFFIDDDESSWTANEVKDYTNQYIKVGLKYLEDKAKEWNVELKFSMQSYSTPLSDYEFKYDGSVIEDLRINGSSKDVLDQAAYAMGYSSNWELYTRLKNKYKTEIIFLTFINKPGLSYTRRVIAPCELTYSEHCVLFSDHIDGDSYANRASTVAHELLHLYGAEDFYEGRRLILANRLYPKDIMLCMPIETYKNEIGDFTAYTVGWTDRIPEICYNENWWK